MEDKIRLAINNALETLVLPTVDFVIEHPKIIDHGDYSSNVAMVLGKEAGLAPRTLAEQILALIDQKIPEVTKIEIAGPGFINFYLSREYFANQTSLINQAPEAWGKGQSWAQKKVVVEYTDPNPFKEFHIGHLFTNAVGESIARLFMMAGAEVKRVCYQGDVGLHVAHAIWGIEKLGLKADSQLSAKDLGRAYVTGATAYKNDEKAIAEIRQINKAIYERTDENINALYDYGRKISLEYFESIYQVVDTQFAEYFFESEAGLRGKELVLNNPDHFKLSDGAYIFEGEQYGLHTRVFLNKEGLPTYEAKELALAKMKEDKLGAYDYSVISTAKEINEYFKVLLKAMSFVYPDLAQKTEHLGHGMVRLTTGKMSSRTGEVIPALDFINEVATMAKARITESGFVEATDELAKDIAIGAIKYATLRGNVTQDSIFDQEKSLSFEGDSGPYLQYTYARAMSVFDKATLAGVLTNENIAPENPYAIEKILYRFPYVVEEALKDRAPHLVVTFLTELAGEFNSFYSTEKIADPSDKHAHYKACLTKAVAATLKNGLWVLGIKAPERL